MAIDTTGECWTGSSPLDLDEYLREYSADSYPIDRFALLKCSCGSHQFGVEVDDDEECARGICSVCSSVLFIADSEENWNPESPRIFECGACQSTVANIGIGFALTKDREAVNRVYLGCRCTKCEILGCMIDWKIAYTPSLQFIPNA
jgi:hypothetical protein